MSVSCRPCDYAATLSRIPKLSRMIDQRRALRGAHRDWPDWCYLPDDLWTKDGWPFNIGEALNDPDALDQIQGDIVLAIWRITKGIYRFDSTVYSAISDTPITGNIPCEILFHLPEWCVYVETPAQNYADDNLHGFFATLNWDEGGEMELHLLLDRDAGLQSVVLPLGSWTLDDAVRKSEKGTAEWLEYVKPSMKQLGVHEWEQYALGERATPSALAPLVSLLVYLCSENAEFGSGTRPTRPQPKNTKRGPRIFPADKPTTWAIGVRMGAALRREYRNEDSQPQGGSHASPRGHIRRAHWHSYWTGPRTSDARTLIVRWIPPIPVNLNDHDDLPAVVRAVGNADDKA